MKIILAFLLSFFLLPTQAQDVSDYKYISISSNFSGFDEGQYQLNNYLRLLLSQKNYEVVSDKTSFWPEEAKLNPCLVLKADVDKVSAAFRNKLILKFEDCNETVLYQFEGDSGIKDYEKGYKDALKKAVQQVNPQNAVMPTYRQEETKEVTLITSTTKEHPGTALFKKYSNQQEKEKINFTDDQITATYMYQGNSYYKSDLEDGEFILVKPNKSEILAHFYPSSQKGIYHVDLNHKGLYNSMVLGFFDGQNLSYEYLSEFRTPVKVEFKKK